jgi:NAD-dependent deacetylase
MGAPPPVPSAKIQRAAELLRESQHAVALTGAGISTPSGIPDFRSEGGLWSQYNPMEVASLSAFRLHPESFFDWIRPLARQLVEAKPNPAHLALARLEREGQLKEIITQNIDGLHQRAGSSTVHEVHGTLDSLTCVSCYTTYKAGDYYEAFVERGEIPRCAGCGGVLKPDTILFEEQLPLTIWKKAEKAARTCDLMLVAGSSLEVTPVARLPVTALNAGANLIIVNHTPTYVDERAEVVIRGDVAEILPRIASQLLD